MQKIGIGYLDGKEKGLSRSLYELCFQEDTKKFVDYYYTEKCRDNRVAALYADGEMAVMVHVNPFRISLYGERADVGYIVAVATRPEFRRRGLMRKLLKQVLEDCYQREEPFSFLMPANPAYYESIGYRYWKNQIEWKLGKEREQLYLQELCSFELRAAQLGRKVGTEGTGTGKAGIEEIGIEKADTADAGARQLADFTNRILEKNFDLFIHRDAAYYGRLKKEQRSEDGDVAVIREENGEIAGVFCYSGEDGMEIREPVFKGNIQETVHPVMMGRIVHLQKFVKMLRFAEPFTEKILLTDDIIPGNNGCFRIHIDAAGAEAEKIQFTEDARVMDIAELGGILFGRMRIFINELV